MALYYLGHLGFRLRNGGTLNRPRLVAALACLPLIPLGNELEALLALTLAAALASSVIAYEAIRWAESRRRVRSTS